MMKFEIIEDNEVDTIFLIKNIDKTDDEIDNEDAELLDVFYLDEILHNNFYDNNNKIIDYLTFIKIIYRNNIYKISDETTEITLKDINQRLLNIFYEDINDEKYIKIFEELSKIIDFNEDNILIQYRLFNLIYQYILLYEDEIIDIYVNNVYPKKVIIEG